MTNKENPKILINNINSFNKFNLKTYLNSNDKHIFYNFLNKIEFLSNLLKELKEISGNAAKENKFSFFSSTINKMIIEKFKAFLTVQLLYFQKNIKNYLKSMKDIKKLITPIIIAINKPPNSADFNNVDLTESDFITLLEINFNSLVTFFEGFEIKEAKVKKDVLDIIDDHINQLKDCVEEFFFDYMITVVYPNNEIKEDLLSSFKKGIIDKILKFYENIYSYLDLQILWEEFEKYSKVQ